MQESIRLHSEVEQLQRASVDNAKLQEESVHERDLYTQWVSSSVAEMNTTLTAILERESSKTKLWLNQLSAMIG